ncbi:MAG: hypothetical protein AAF716_08805 [Cyanobacteria bacterium P01_D01_bin.1]
MSDTTAYLAGCATTGVAALVLLVARVGMVSTGSELDLANRQNDQQSDRFAQVESIVSSQQPDAQSQQALETEIRRELDKQRTLTQKLEEQLSEQETLSASLETQLQEQSEKTQDLLSRIQDYQRSVEDIELEDKIAAAVRPTTDAATQSSGPSTSLIWLGAGVVIILGLGGGGLILCSILLILQSQRRSVRPMPMPPMPMPPASDYRYYDPALLPPTQVPPRRPSYYDYPPSPYDYTP